jgi:hypothetical protein
MVQYTLHIDPGADGADHIKKELKQYIAIAKVVDPPDSNDSLPNVAWVSFVPWDKNEINWEVGYSLYATQSEIKAGVTITQDSPFAGPDVGELYSFKDGDWSDEGKSDHSDAYSLHNNNGDTLNFGLAQTVTVQGKATSSPLAVTTVGNNEYGYYVPQEVVYVFLFNYGNNGVVWEVQSTELKVVLTPKESTKCVGFKIEDNTFYEKACT